jgi:flagellar FliJ protein
MKKFRFSLDTVLDYRRQVQDALQVELGALTALVRQQEKVLLEEEAVYAALNREYREKKQEGMSIADMRTYETGLEVQEGRIRQAAELLRQRLAEMEAKRGELVKAKQDASSVEKLREKKLGAYHKDLEKSEEQFIDDLVGARRASASGASL